MAALQQATERIIRLTAGVGEPATMRTTAGTQLGPLSLGHRASWRIVAVGVRDEHAFLYFDGETLFVQSVEPDNPAFLNGQPVPRDWVPVPLGSEIAIGEARLSFEIEEAAAKPPRPKPRPFAPGEFVNEDSVVPVARAKKSSRPPPPAAQTPPDGRPFAPGELAVSDPDVTRLAPIEEIAATRPRPRPMPGPPRGGTVQMAALPPGAAPNPAVPPPVVISPSAYPPGMQPPPSDPNAAMPPAYTPMGGVPMAMPPGMPPPAPSGPGMTAPPPAAASTSIAAKIGPYVERAKAIWRAAPPPRKAIFVLTPLVLVSVFVLFSGSSPPPKRPPAPVTTTTAPTGPDVRGTSAPATAPSMDVNETGPIVPTPPAPTAEPDTSATAVASASTNAPPAPTAGGKGTQPPKKTLERAAADAVAAGAFLEAAALYEQLAREHPENPAFAEAARILRNKGRQTP